MQLEETRLLYRRWGVGFPSSASRRKRLIGNRSLRNWKKLTRRFGQEPRVKGATELGEGLLLLGGLAWEGGVARGGPSSSRPDS